MTMSSFANNSGLIFVTGSYREFVPHNGYFDFKGRLDSLARDFGEYFRLSPIVEVDQEHFVHVAVNKDEGILLGEYIASMYPDTEHLLYCEQVEADGTCLVVCIQSGTIILDQLISPGQISQDIWLQIIHTASKYKVVVAGGKSIIDWDETKAPNVIPSKCIDTSERLVNGHCLDVSSVSSQLKSKDVSKAAARVGIKPLGRRLAIAASIIVVAGIAGLYSLGSHDEAATVTLAPVDLYKNYRTELNTPSAGGNVLATLHLMARASMLPGWKIKEAGLSPTNTFAEMIPAGGSLSDLETFAERFGLVIRRKDNATVFYDRRVTKPREFPNVIYKLQDVVNHISDMTNVMYDGKSVASEMVVTGKVFKRDITVTAKNALLDDVAMFAESLSDLPVVLKDIRAEPREDFFDFTIQLTAFGEHIDKS